MLPPPSSPQDCEHVTQYGSREVEPPFRRRPRYPRENDLSLLRGWLNAAEACRLVRGRDVANCPDGVRHSTVGLLRAAGYLVEHTPSTRIPGHISVRCLDRWGSEQDTEFDDCFGTPVWRTEESS